MKRFILALTSTVVALVLPSCLQSETTIHLQKDGSGTLTEQTTYGARMLAMLAQMSAAGGKMVKDPLADLSSPEKAKARAATLGPGVTVEKSIPYESGGNKGATVTYHFTDINKLTISPGDSIKNLSPMAAGAPAATQAKPVAFTYTGGTLTVTMPAPPTAAATPETPSVPGMPDMENPQMQAMMKQMLADMKMSFKLVIEPGIAETDASLQDGNTVTLMDLQMVKLLEKPETLKKLSKAPQQDPVAALEFIKGLEGVTMETKKQISISVK